MSPRTVLLLSPTALPAITGNAVTVERLRRSLAPRGYDLRPVATASLSPEALIEALRASAPEIVHAYHAFKGGAPLLHPLVLPSAERIPWVVSLPGTDVDQDLTDPERRAAVAAVCERASAIATQSRATLDRFAALFPGLRDRVALCPKAFAWLGDAPFDLRGAADCARGDLVFFHPAGVRPVKGNLECLAPLARVHAARPHVRAVFAGPPLDEEYAVRFAREVERRSDFARWIAPIPLEAMRAAYAGADVVLNSSRTEGLSNVLLEAAAAGVPILASDCAGNRGPVLGDEAAGERPIGLLYGLDDPEDFVRQALRLVDDPASRRALGEAGRERAARAPTPAEEACAFAAVYLRALGA